jgi:hypothetical protein
MKPHYLLLLIIGCVAGCQAPPPQNPAPQTPPIEGLKISDLEDNSESIDEQSLMTFRVLTYHLVPSSVDKLAEVFDSLSRKDIREANKQAFQVNGFGVGTAPFEQGGQLAQQLAAIGAERTALARLMFPPDSKEAFSRILLQPAEQIHYLNSLNTASTIESMQGFLGWILSAKPDPRFRRAALVELFPAVWQPGLQNIRLVMGNEPVDYQPIPAGQILLRIQEGGVILLGPVRSVPDETTLDKKLFFLPGRKPKIQFYVIICDSVGN